MLAYLLDWSPPKLDLWMWMVALFWRFGNGKYIGIVKKLVILKAQLMGPSEFWPSSHGLMGSTFERTLCAAPGFVSQIQRQTGLPWAGNLPFNFFMSGKLFVFTRTYKHIRSGNLSGVQILIFQTPQYCILNLCHLSHFARDGNQIYSSCNIGKQIDEFEYTLLT